MTRIIAGFAGSLTLVVPSTGTRPTTDRLRESIFSALDARGVIAGATVLDLYAGSGALGLEAASRGAAAVTLVERDRAGVAACRSNAAVVSRAAPRTAVPTITVTASAVQQFLDSSRALWDVVLIDPPYGLETSELEANLAALVPLLSPHAVVVVERGARDPAPGLPSGLELEKSKSHGDTVLYWLRPA